MNREIQRLRGLAVLMTIVTHVTLGRWPGLFNNAWGGVDLFFVISGFVITNSLHRLLPDFPREAPWDRRLAMSRRALRVFFARRFYRIVPLAVVVMALTFVVSCISHALVAHSVFEKPTMIAREMLTIAGGFYNYALATHAVGYDLVGYWSLCVEEHFYLLFPFVLIAFPRWNQRLVAVAGLTFVVGLVLRPLSFRGVVTEADYTLARFLTHAHCDGLLFGAVLALLGRRGWGRSLATGNPLERAVAALCVGLLWLMPGVAEGGRLPNQLLLSLAAVSGVLVFFAAAERGIISVARPVDQALEYVGERSYALYLSHRMVLDAWTDAGVGNIGRWSWPILVMGFILFAELLYRTVERPFLAYGKRRCEALQAAPAPATEPGDMAA